MQVRGLGGNDQLAHAPVRHAALAAIAVEQAAPFYAAARFQRARRVIHAGVDDLAVARRRAGADGVGTLQHD